MEIKKKAMLLLSTLGTGVLLTAEVAFALEAQCAVGTSPDNPCLGTEARDTLVGTAGPDFIERQDSKDVLRGLGFLPDPSCRYYRFTDPAEPLAPPQAISPKIRTSRSMSK